MERSVLKGGSIEEINIWTQQNFLRQGERWQKQSSGDDKLRPELMPLLRELGFVEAVLPRYKKYQGAVLHGGMLSKVRLRLQYLVEQWKQGVRFYHLYFLSGQRPLESRYENIGTFIQPDSAALELRQEWCLTLIPRMESEMVQMVWEQSEIPADMRSEVTVYFIDAPMKEDSRTGIVMRPTTDDTVVAWLKVNPSPGRYLVVSNAPYIKRQDLVMRAISPACYMFDTIGAGAGGQESVAVFLDELARCIYQELVFYNKSIKFAKGIPGCAK